MSAANRIGSKSDIYQGEHGYLSKRKMAALLDLRATASHAIRQYLRRRRFTEITTASLVNIAGTCENPQASFPLDFYGGEAFLSQSAQLQLEPIVLRLKRKVFTQAMSFRAEHFQDPASPERRLSEFTLAEAEMPFPDGKPERALMLLATLVESLVRYIIRQCLKTQTPSIRTLGGQPSFLEQVASKPFQRITWEEARAIIERRSGRVPPDDFGIAEERFLLHHFGQTPVFVMMHPSSVKFFNIKRTLEGKRCYSLDLLLPLLGKLSGGRSARRVWKRFGTHCMLRT